MSSSDARADDALRIVAIVNDEPISMFDVAARVQFQAVVSGQRPSREASQELGAAALRQLIDEHLELQEAKDKEVTVADADISSDITDLEKSNHMQPGAIFAMLDAAHIPHETLTQQIHARIAWERTVVRRMHSEIHVSDEDIDDAMRQLRANFGKPQYAISEIFLAVTLPDSEASVKETATRLVTQARDGTNFGALARQFSDSAAAAADGDLGWVYAAELEPKLGQMVTAMKPGEISDPIRTQTGFHILAVRDQRIQGTEPEKIVLSEAMLPTEAGDHGTLLGKAQVIAAEAKDCNAFAKETKAAGGVIGADQAAIVADQLSERDHARLTQMKIGEVSKPNETSHGIELIMVCERKNGSNTLPTREEVSRKIEFERVDSESRSYLRDLRLAAFVDIRS